MKTGGAWGVIMKSNLIKQFKCLSNVGCLFGIFFLCVSMQALAISLTTEKSSGYKASILNSNIKEYNKSVGSSNEELKQLLKRLGLSKKLNQENMVGLRKQLSGSYENLETVLRAQRADVNSETEKSFDKLLAKVNELTPGQIRAIWGGKNTDKDLLPLFGSNVTKGDLLNYHTLSSSILHLTEPPPNGEASLEWYEKFKTMSSDKQQLLRTYKGLTEALAKSHDDLATPDAANQANILAQQKYVLKERAEVVSKGIELGLTEVDFGSYAQSKTLSDADASKISNYYKQAEEIEEIKGKLKGAAEQYARSQNTEIQAAIKKKKANEDNLRNAKDEQQLLDDYINKVDTKAPFEEISETSFPIRPTLESIDITDYPGAVISNNLRNYIEKYNEQVKSFNKSPDKSKIKLNEYKPSGSKLEQVIDFLRKCIKSITSLGNSWKKSDAAEKDMLAKIKKSKENIEDYEGKLKGFGGLVDSKSSELEESKTSLSERENELENISNTVKDETLLQAAAQQYVSKGNVEPVIGPVKQPLKKIQAIALADQLFANDVINTIGDVTNIDLLESHQKLSEALAETQPGSGNIASEKARIALTNYQLVKKCYTLQESESPEESAQAPVTDDMTNLDLSLKLQTFLNKPDIRKTQPDLAKLTLDLMTTVDVGDPYDKVSPNVTDIAKNVLTYQRDIAAPHPPTKEEIDGTITELQGVTKTKPNSEEGDSATQKRIFKIKQKIFETNELRAYVNDQTEMTHDARNSILKTQVAIETLKESVTETPDGIKFKPVLNELSDYLNTQAANLNTASDDNIKKIDGTTSVIAETTVDLSEGDFNNENIRNWAHKVGNNIEQFSKGYSSDYEMINSLKSFGKSLQSKSERKRVLFVAGASHAVTKLYNEEPSQEMDVTVRASNPSIMKRAREKNRMVNRGRASNPQDSERDHEFGHLEEEGGAR